MKIVATTSLPAVDRLNADRWNAARSRQKEEKTDENSGHYVIASSRPPERRPLERRTLAPIFQFLLVPAYFCCGWVKSPIYDSAFKICIWMSVVRRKKLFCYFKDKRIVFLETPYILIWMDGWMDGWIYFFLKCY